MNTESTELETLREITSKVLITLLWLHVALALAIGLVRGEWLLPTQLTLGFAAAATAS
jgi:methyl-accepting chemotaxis protein